MYITCQLSHGDLATHDPLKYSVCGICLSKQKNLFRYSLRTSLCPSLPPFLLLFLSLYFLPAISFLILRPSLPLFLLFCVLPFLPLFCPTLLLPLLPLTLLPSLPPSLHSLLTSSPPYFSPCLHVLISPSLSFFLLFFLIPSFIY